jgi:hypothetical protein
MIRPPVKHVGFREAADRARHMGERRKVARGADGALLGDHRMQARVEEGDQALDQLDLGSGIVGREGVGPEQHHRPGHVLGEGLADAGRVGIDGLALVGRHVGDEDALILEQPNPGIEGVHERRVVMHPGSVDIGPRRRDPLPRLGGQRSLRVAPMGVRTRHAHHVLNFKRCPVELDRHDDPSPSSQKGYRGRVPGATGVQGAHCLRWRGFARR